MAQWRFHWYWQSNSNSQRSIRNTKAHNEQIWTQAVTCTKHKLLRMSTLCQCATTSTVQHRTFLMISPDSQLPTCYKTQYIFLSFSTVAVTITADMHDCPPPASEAGLHSLYMQQDVTICRVTTLQTIGNCQTFPPELAIIRHYSSCSARFRARCISLFLT